MSLFLVACGGGVGDAAPRVSAIPVQQAPGIGKTFTLDVSDFVTDREGDSLSYAVLSGGGSFTGATYSHMFDSMGSWTVTFQVADIEKVTSASFVVRVKGSNWLVDRVDSKSLRLLDSNSRKMETVTNSSNPETFKVGTDNGWMIFERTQGTNTDLFAYDSFDKVVRTLGDSSTKNEQYVARTTTDKIVFTVGTSLDLDLFIWNSATNLVKTISATEDAHDRNARVGASNRIYYERETNGQADIYYYDPATDVTITVSTNAKNESIQSTLADGGVVFSRPGDGGETDLFYYNVGVGVVEAGGTVALDTINKTYKGAGPNGEIVFSVPGATNLDLYFWKPSDGSTTAAGANVTYAVVTTDAKVIFDTTTNSGDLSFYDMVTGSAAVSITTNASTEVFKATVAKAGVSYVVYERQASPTSLQVYNLTGATTDSITNAANLEIVMSLDNGDFAYRTTTGTAIFHYETTGGTESAVDTGTTVTYAGLGKNGSFVYSKDNATAGTDLHMWENPTTSTLTVTAEGGTQAYGSVTFDGDIVFTRMVSPNTTSDLFFFDVSARATSRLTNEEFVDDQGSGNYRDHDIVGTFEGRRTGY